MIVIDNTIISDELKNVFFSCDLLRCKGECCVEGDAGAPLEEEEISVLEDYIDDIKPFMNEQGRKTVEETGVFEYDIDGEMVTPLVNNRECAFVVFENGMAMCAIEKAWMSGKIGFRKPVSCHLYPVRVSKLKNHIAVNYHKWDICNVALLKGKKENMPLYKYLEEPLIRKFGEAWYRKLTLAIEKK
jgi:hypothetical protein